MFPVFRMFSVRTEAQAPVSIRTQLSSCTRHTNTTTDLILLFFALQKYHHNKRCTIFDGLLSYSILVSLFEKAPPPFFLVNRTSVPVFTKACHSVTSSPTHTTEYFFKMFHLRLCLPMLSFLLHF